MDRMSLSLDGEWQDPVIGNREPGEIKPSEEHSDTFSLDEEILQEEQVFLKKEEESVFVSGRSWFGRELTKNTGSHARDHLANERTFLAWLRTSLGSIGLGVAVAKLSLAKYSEISGLAFIIVGTIFLLYASVRYFIILGLLNRGLFEANKFGVGLIVVLAIIAIVVSFVVGKQYYVLVMLITLTYPVLI